MGKLAPNSSLTKTKCSHQKCSHFSPYFHFKKIPNSAQATQTSASVTNLSVATNDSSSENAPVNENRRHNLSQKHKWHSVYDFRGLPLPGAFYQARSGHRIQPCPEAASTSYPSGRIYSGEPQQNKNPEPRRGK